jgi:hypothetical protein
VNHRESNLKGPISMKRHITLLAAIALAVSVAGCGDNLHNHRLGAVNNYNAIPCETITLGSTTVFSANRLTLSVDTLSYVVVTTGTWNGSYGLQGSNDNSTWIDITLPTTPPASTGSAQSFSLDYEGGWSKAYARVKFAGSSSTGSAQVCPVLKG